MGVFDKVLDIFRLEDETNRWENDGLNQDDDPDDDDLDDGLDGLDDLDDGLDDLDDLGDYDFDTDELEDDDLDDLDVLDDLDEPGDSHAPRGGSGNGQRNDFNRKIKLFTSDYAKQTRREKEYKKLQDQYGSVVDPEELTKTDRRDRSLKKADVDYYFDDDPEDDEDIDFFDGDEEDSSEDSYEDPDAFDLEEDEGGDWEEDPDDETADDGDDIESGYDDEDDPDYDSQNVLGSLFNRLFGSSGKKPDRTEIRDEAPEPGPSRRRPDPDPDFTDDMVTSGRKTSERNLSGSSSSSRSSDGYSSSSGSSSRSSDGYSSASGRIPPKRNTISVIFLQPRDMEDSKQIGDALIRGALVCLDLRYIPELALKQRIIDFAGGACYSMGISLHALPDDCFFLSPPHVKVSGAVWNMTDSNGNFLGQFEM